MWSQFEATILFACVGKCSNISNRAMFFAHLKLGERLVC